MLYIYILVLSSPLASYFCDWAVFTLSVGEDLGVQHPAKCYSSSPMFRPTSIVARWCTRSFLYIFWNASQGSWARKMRVLTLISHAQRPREASLIGDRWSIGWNHCWGGEIANPGVQSFTTMVFFLDLVNPSLISILFYIFLHAVLYKMRLILTQSWLLSDYMNVYSSLIVVISLLNRSFKLLISFCVLERLNGI